MKLIDWISLFTIASLSLNVFLLIRQRSKPQKTPEKTYDAAMLMRDLTSGEAIVRVTRIAPEDVILRSPRDL